MTRSRPGLQDRLTYERFTLLRMDFGEHAALWCSVCDAHLNVGSYAPNLAALISAADRHVCAS